MLTKDPVTGAVEIPLAYRHSSKESPFMVPPDSIQMMPDAFFKAECFGFTIKLMEDVYFKEQGAFYAGEFIKGKDEYIEIDTGLELQVPPTLAFLHVGLLEGAMNYVVDKQTKEFYKVNLYFNNKMKSGNYAKGQPAYKILPLNNAKYSFKYRRYNV